jgi:hypothetical protein
MKPTLIAAIALIVAGTLALAYGGFTYTKDSDTTTIGPLKITMRDRQTVNVPVWAGVASIAIGAGMLLVPILGRGGVLPKSLR